MEYTVQELIDFDNEGNKYKYLVGKFINSSNELEGMAKMYVVDHYVDIKNVKEVEKFMADFIVRDDMTFQRITKLFFKILKSNHEDFHLENRELINDTTLKKIVWLRNILAHSIYTIGGDSEYHRLSWFSTDIRLKSYGINKNYVFNVEKEEFEIYYKKLVDINEKIVKNIINKKSDKKTHV